MNNYVVYHLHDEMSLLDSVTKFTDYVDMAIENNMKAIACTNHGNIYHWIERVLYCQEKGIKYLHGCEVYLTESLEEKIRDNYHTVLIAKNKEGIKELNTLVGLATRKDHMYYKPRLSFEEFLNISDNIIKISACLQSPLNRYNKNSLLYEKVSKHYDYYEIQYHDCDDQREYNHYLYGLSKKNNIPLIVGTDTHSSNKYKAECRTMRQYSKNITFENEDEFDLTFKNYQELLDMFSLQNGSIPKDEILKAINNTNIMADSCDEIILDTSFKYPILSDNDEETLKQRVNKMYAEKIEKGIIDGDNPQYIENIHEEFRVLKKIGMLSFMLFMSEMIEWCEDNGIPTCPCRGSVGGSTLAYIIGITDVNPIIWKTYFSRFANEDRKEIGDIDCDFSPSQRELVYEYIINRFGWEKTAYILAIGTSAEKGTIDDIGRGLDLMYKKKGEHSIYTLSFVEKIKKEYEVDPQKAREDYPELFYYFDGMVNTAVSQSMHPAGIVASPITLYDNYGIFYNKDDQIVLQIDMEEVHEVSLVKYDILGLKNIEVIKDCCEYANVEYPKCHTINFDDEEVWADMIECPIGIFQFESDFASKTLKEFEPHKINDLSLVNASIRPSGSSYRDDLIAKKPHKNPSKLIDDLLADNNGYLVFQEDTIAFLQNICGLSGSDADNIRRAIGRKQRDRLEKAMPQILEGYCSKSDKPRKEAEEEAKAFLQIIEDSANYQFGKNHSTGYSIIGYYCAYFRYYYPLEFTTSYLNNANNSEDINDGHELAKVKGITIKPPKFRYSRAEYFMDKETNSIYKGMASIKYMNAEVSEQLYGLKDNQYDNFMDLLIDIYDKTSINSRQLNILIAIDFFEEFGESQKLLDIVKLYENIMSKKIKSKKGEVSFNKVDLPYPQEIIEKYATEKSKEDKYKQYKVENALGLCYELMNDIPNMEMSSIDKIRINLDAMGECNYYFEDYNPTTCIVVDVITKFKTKKAWLFSIASGHIAEVNIGEGYYNLQPFKALDVIDVFEITQKPKKEKREVEVEDKNGNKVTKMKYVPTGEMKLYLSEYHLLDKEEIDELNEQEKEYREGLIYED